MKSARQFSLVVVAVVALSVSAWAQGTDYSKIEILTDKIAPNLYMLSGSAGADPGHQDAAGGRIGVLAGPDGISMSMPNTRSSLTRSCRRSGELAPGPFVF